MLLIPSRSYRRPILVSVLLAAAFATACSSIPATATIVGTVTRGPTCPVVQEGEACDDAPAPGTVLVLDAKRRQVASAPTNADGVFEVAVKPGHWFVTAEVEGVMSCAETEIDARDGKRTIADVSCDTGIR